MECYEGKDCNDLDTRSGAKRKRQSYSSETPQSTMQRLGSDPIHEEVWIDLTVDEDFPVPKPTLDQTKAVDHLAQNTGSALKKTQLPPDSKKPTESEVKKHRSFGVERVSEAFSRRFNEDSVPENEPPSGDDNALRSLLSTSKEYHELKARINDSCPGIELLKIEKVNDPRRRKKFESHRCFLTESKVMARLSLFICSRLNIQPLAGASEREAAFPWRLG